MTYFIPTPPTTIRIRLVGLVCSGLGVRNLGCGGFPSESVRPMHNLGLSESIMLAGQSVIWIKGKEGKLLPLGK